MLAAKTSTTLTGTPDFAHSSESARDNSGPSDHSCRATLPFSLSIIDNFRTDDSRKAAARLRQTAT
jgi:hypothetical protein